ncbi:MAG TPA: hypothetical protein VLH79_00010 [Chthonomonadales bacterium]|nr:hypothetical protein [Chthonomonadales bacterium]
MPSRRHRILGLALFLGLSVFMTGSDRRLRADPAAALGGLLLIAALAAGLLWRL